MRWERLFDDLEGQFDAAERQEFDAEVADRTRRELALVSLEARLSMAVGTVLELTVEGAGLVVGAVSRVGQGWVLVDESSGRECVVTLPAILTVGGLPMAVAPPDSNGAVASRLDLGYVLRGIARDRSAVALVLRNSVSYDGTIDRVGADFVDLAEHPVGEARRAASISAIRTVAFGGLAAVRAG